MTTYTRFGTYNAVLPSDGPKTYPFTADFRTIGSFGVDLTNEVTQGFIKFLSGGFFDNSNNANPLTIVVPTTNQKVIIPAKSQAYLPLLFTDTVSLQLTTTVDNQLLVPFFLCNFPITPAIWSVA